MSPEERNEVFQLTWGLRQLVSDNKDSFPKPGAALLHDALTHAALFFIEAYEREWERSSSGATSVEPTPETEKVTAIDEYREYRERLKAS